MSTSAFWRPLPVFSAAAILRITLFFYGLYQDANSPLKYTDIDYAVFTSAAVAPSPYDRETYRYTPLLAWLLFPTSTWFSFGKVLFALSDLVAGWLIVLVLQRGDGSGNGTGKSMEVERALKFASLWLLNPMVATISTRGSSEGLLGVMVIALVWAVLGRKTLLAGVLLGLGVHFKIYPGIYAPSIVWWMDEEHLVPSLASNFERKKGYEGETGAWGVVAEFCNRERVKITVVSLATFMSLNSVMYYIYGWPFLQHTYLHHITRIDHRHNFSPYNTLLYLSSSLTTPTTPYSTESLAFLPQLLLSGVLLPILLAKKSLPSTLLAQTFAFVSFNKVCTSQYFLWYMVFLPFYLPTSSLLAQPRLGLAVLAAWIGTQGLWLWNGWRLEFLGESTFVGPGGGLWGASIAFFAVNVWILGIVVRDIGGIGDTRRTDFSNQNT